MENRVRILKDKLEAFKINLLLNDSVGTCKYCSSCDVAEEKVRNEPWFKFLCYQFVRNIEYIYGLIYLNSSLKEKRCNTLIYWIYDKVANFYSNPQIKRGNVNIINEILKVWKEINTNKVTDRTYICELPAEENTKDLNEMKRKKIMSDYCEDYSELRRLLTKRHSSECNIYYDYFKNSFLEFRDIAKENKEECLRISNCSGFCDKYDLEDIFKRSKCEVIEISDGKNDYIKQEDCNESISKAVSEKICETKEVPNPEFTFSDKRAIILTLFSSWGMFLTLLFLYKMTPFRSWIRNKLEKKKIIRDSFNDQSDSELLDADYESVDRDMLNTEYNITYNSDWNSSH
ncbi:PIR Superfamily Protein [Plasmodium ovale wallikeri]|uniref:PIR Superfamily Protein n=1 Tax=Plasmodium ovale wallikeri TaxID=864142 RepID=A0A1A9ASU1_PLAOA|nr:PIR Superfamily Protein [Plasmodium ovale wallikeri]